MDTPNRISPPPQLRIVWIAGKMVKQLLEAWPEPRGFGIVMMNDERHGCQKLPPLMSPPQIPTKCGVNLIWWNQMFFSMMRWVE
ncbi:hypothetical protein KIN20_018190 [Parelaphostrongylus tenuis]|uniref:Uncharacterized protein n=1 Tax=Parelaphostrongylus tenuis TaxID=148309 RepID=A0AAD5MJ27_PARTN|nr:hypothetical protein KIN20_018190 [Parelaphostrongylus tenuis]